MTHIEQIATVTLDWLQTEHGIKNSGLAESHFTGQGDQFRLSDLSTFFIVGKHCTRLTAKDRHLVAGFYKGQAEVCIHQHPAPEESCSFHYDDPDYLDNIAQFINGTDQWPREPSTPATPSPISA